MPNLSKGLVEKHQGHLSPKLFGVYTLKAYPPPRIPVANKGLGGDSLPKM